MIAVHEAGLSERVARLHRLRRDVTVREAIVLAGQAPSDEQLAEIIDLDARQRLDKGLPVELAMYLDAVPSLPRLPVSLDAALEFTIRSMMKSGISAGAAAETLIANYPILEPAIRSASVLGDILCSTSHLHADVPVRTKFSVPCEFGPSLPNGLARYELRELLGSGTHGDVYLASDRYLSATGKPAWVAIKVLTGADDDIGESFRRAEEATRARRINHPSVVRVLDRGRTGAGDEYIVYEYVDGRTLQDWFLDRSMVLSPRDAAGLVIEIARGVQAAHSAGVVHCDLKPDNFLIGRDGRPKVTDFGLAVCLRDDGTRDSVRASTPIGSLAFIAPEQFRLEDGAFGIPADVYALGGMLYYLLTGAFPNGATVEEVERNLEGASRRRAAPDPREKRREVDGTLAAICMRAMRAEAADRYRSAEAMANDLESWLAKEPIAWMRPSTCSRLRLFAQRQPLAAVLVVVLLFACGAVGGSAVYFSVREEHRVAKAMYEAANEFEAASTSWYEQLSNSMEATQRAMWGKKGEGLAENWIAGLTVVESLCGPEVFIKGDRQGTFWRRRIETAQEIVRESERTGNRDDLDSLFWSTALGFWELRRGHAEEASKVLEENLSDWLKKINPDDPWVKRVEQILAAARLRVILNDSSLTSRAARTPPLLEQLAILEKQAEVFTGRREGDPMHRAVLEAMMDGYSPAGVDQSEDYRRIKAQYDRLD